MGRRVGFVVGGARVGPERVQRFSLPNGLEVRLAPIADSPTTSVWVWYRVGSKNERPGITGASHWVEHMLFQGSPKYPKGAVDRAVVEVGGSLNAFTDTDFTAYFTTVPRAHLGIPLDIEADRMTRATIAPEEVDRERTVVRSEREGNENWPEFRVDEELFALAFHQHPYRWDPLGYPEDILAMDATHLQEYYRRFYGTTNALMVISGGFDAGPTARRIRRDFGRLPRTGADPRVTVREPPQRSAREATLTGPGTTPFFEAGWHAGAVGEDDAPALILLDVVLGGETRLFAAGSAWGRRAEHPSSRLYRRLVDPGLAVRASSEWRPRLHPGLFTIHAQAAEGVPISKLEGAMEEELARLLREGPSSSELQEARQKIRRGALLAYEGATRCGFRIGYLSMLGSEGFEGRLLQRVLHLPPSEVRRVARDVFVRDNRTLVRYLPTGGSEGD